MQRLGGVASLRGETVRLQHVERLEQQDAARTGRRHRDHFVPAVVPPQRFPFLCLVRGQIGLRDQPAVRFHVFGDRVGNPSFIEGVRAVESDRAQRLREIGQDETIAAAPCATARFSVRFDRRRKMPHCPGELTVETARERIGDDESLLREIDGRHHDVLPRELAEPPMGARESADGAGHAGREVAFRRQRAVDLPVLVQIHRSRRFRGRLLAVIERRRLALGRPDDHEPAAADVACARMGDGERERRGNGGIDGVAAAREHRRAGVACGGRRADDEARFR